MITCTVCGRNYKRCTGGKRHFWNCPTAVQTDLPSCGTSQIPEKLLYDLAAQVLGLAQAAMDDAAAYARRAASASAGPIVSFELIQLEARRHGDRLAE